MTSSPQADDLVAVDPKAIAADIARELREHPEHWYQGDIAATEKGHSLDDAKDPTAVCWCLEGLIEKHTDYRGKIRVLEAFRDALGIRTLFVWNDSRARTVNDVIDLCDKVASV